MLVKAEASIPESQAIFQDLLSNPGKIFDLLRFELRTNQKTRYNVLGRQSDL
jgi:hypothetical protein